MDVQPLAFDSPLDRYEAQAAELLEQFHAAAPWALHVLRHNYPPFLNEKIPWLPKDVSDEEMLAAGLDISDAQLALARWYDFADWPALANYAAAVIPAGSAAHRFEASVEAVITGDSVELGSLLRSYPELVSARSERMTKFDPPVHRATLLHYVAANGVEGYRQKTPANAVEIAELLLRFGAAPDALAGMYGGECATMSMLVSSDHPARAGVQVALVNVLIDFGAAVDDRGHGPWKSPLMTALAFGYLDAAKALVSRGAKVETLAAAAGLGRFEDARRMLPTAGPEDRHRALALSCLLGHADIARLLLDNGEDPDRFNPEGNHAHSTPLHQAVCAGHADVVRLLVERGARLDIRDTIWNGTPLGWAEHCKQNEIEEYLRAQRRD